MDGGLMMRKAILAALLLGASTQLDAAPAAKAAALPDADPALWVVKDADTTVYMFGTVHGLDGQTDWFNDEVKVAYDKSGEVVVEAIMPEDPAAMQPLVTKYAMDQSGRTLRSKLSPEVRTQYEKVMAELGMPAPALDGFEPWMVNLTLAAGLGTQIGLKPEHGADMVIKRAAKKDGKPVSELEGAEWQLSLFDKMPEAQQIRHLEISLKQFPEAKPLLQQMVAAWNKGDPDKLDGIMNRGMAETPELREVLLGDRNATWAKWIKTRLEKPGTVFMAVGAGHLTGHDSVQAKLAEHGLKSERVPANYGQIAAATTR
jgi:uncharacterized protein YbaP (TraB family)